jgi:HSP20 family protein
MIQAELARYLQNVRVVDRQNCHFVKFDNVSFYQLEVSMNAVSNGSRFNLLPMNAFSREMNRWIDELSGEATHKGVAPTSAWEDDTHYHFEFDLPGVSIDQIDLRVVENVLHLSANRTVDEGRSFILQERSFGEIERRFSLPVRIDESGISAEMQSGVLSVSVPKAPEAQVKKIEIRSND